jgi:hypothetical protein
MRARIAAVIALAAAAGLAIAQTGTTPKPVLHEPLPEPSSDHAPNPMIGASQNGGNPAAFSAGDKVLPKPALDAKKDRTAGTQEPVLGKPGFAADRDTQMKADEHTGADPTLHYVSVFNPDVIPFKRMSTFDKINDDQTLHVASTALVEVPVGGTTDPKTRDRFWGDVLVNLTPGKDVPLPSVAPDMRILSYEIKPKMALKFSKDGADNFYVRSDEASASGTYRLVFLADADAGYFAPSLPRTQYKVRDIKSHAPPELVEQLNAVPVALRREAQDTLQKHINVDENYGLDLAFNGLVRYFRAFEAKDIKRPTGDTYRDLCDSQAGVCRHRSFAFMITANALGIPTRYVENEAHAFVEVWFPERGWQRIDLGGAALRLDVQGAQDKTMHRPRADDPFAKPPEYGKNGSYSQLQGDIRGLSDRQLADKHKALDQSPPSGAIGDSGGNTGSGSTPDRMSPDPTLRAEEPDPKKHTPSIRITIADASAYRGGSIHLEGIVTSEGRAVADHSVRVYISPTGEGGKDPIPLGLATTAADGTFRVDLPIPARASLSTYDLLLMSDPDAYFNGARSE